MKYSQQGDWSMTRIWVAVATLGLSLSAPAAAQMVQAPAAAEPAAVGVVEVETVPHYRVKDPIQAPRAHRETPGAAPSQQAVWIPGYWDLLGDKNTASRAGWVWIPGTWVLPPKPGLHWSAAHWGFRDDWWSWIPAHWTRRPAGGLDSLSTPT
jgi:hypothetical protein